MATWIVTGSNRGIGLAMCRQLHARGEAVYAACRIPSKELAAVGCKVVEGIDVTSDEAEALIGKALGDGVIDVLVHNAGILVPDVLASLDVEAIRRQFETNTLGPLRLTKALLPKLRKGSKIGFVSSRAGSIGDHPGGGLYGYRLSKSALNMVGANLACDLGAQGIMVVVLHPGSVRTEMTGGSGIEDAPTAAKGLLDRIDELTPATTGRFMHMNGQELPW